MKKNREYALSHIGLSEGGYTNNRWDRGNWYKGRLIGTNHGISAPVLARWIGRTPTVAEMKALTKAEAKKIFVARFFMPVWFDDMPSGVDLALADWSVNSGPRRAIQGLQRAVGTIPDGIIGGITMKAVSRLDAKTIINRLTQRRMSFLQRLGGKNGWATFGVGWTRRVRRVHSDALKLAVGENSHG